MSDSYKLFLDALATVGTKVTIHPEPIREAPPDFQTDLVRPDDLVALHVDGYNFKPVLGPSGPTLNRIDSAKDALLVVTFPPQNIAETAYFQTTSSTTLPPPPPGITPPPNPAAGNPGQPGQTAARLAGFTRLVFRLPANAPMPAIPYGIEGLLDWSGFDLVVTPLADLPEGPSSEQVATAPDITPPGAKETSIELPYRLILSPQHTVTWLHATAPVTHASRTELWHTRLALKAGDGTVSELTPTHTAPLRAIWSPDYNPGRAFDTNLSPTQAETDPDLGVSDISPNDRHQIVILTSAFRGYVDQDDTPFVPSPVQAQMLMLSPLGGWLRSRGHWDPPHANRFLLIPPRLFGTPVEMRDAARPGEARMARTAAAGVITGPVAARPTIPPLTRLQADVERLDLSEWVHIAAQGRDHYVRIVYEGHLYPFGHRAALIKITERKFKDVTLPDGSTTPVAHMIQREYIVVREPEKIYTGHLSGNAGVVAGRRLPLTKIRLTTLITPDLTEPRGIIGDFSSWVVVGDSPGHDFKFHAVATDIAGNAIEFTASLIFAALSDTPAKLPAIQQAYAGSGDRRACAVPKQKLTYAPRNLADTSTDNTTLVTSALYFDTDSYASLLASFGGYLPKLFKAEVHIPAIEQLVGAAAATTIRLYEPYVTGDFDPHAGVFAEIVKEVGGALAADNLPVTFTADKAGGIATPNLNLSNLTRAHGPLAGSAANAAKDLFDAGDFFSGFAGDLIPKLFGAINLTDLLPIAGLGSSPSAAKNAPKTQFRTIDNPDGSKTLLATFDWAPDVGPASAGFATFTPNDNGITALTIHGEIRKPVTLPPAGPPNLNKAGSFAFKGDLSFFSLEILNAIVLHFTRFSFSAGSGQKLDVNVDLDQTEPFEFKGDLQFVQDLSNIIPPGAFGDGPSIELTTEPSIHVAYGVMLPPVAVGVFSLENIVLSAGLDLPLLSGKPRFDIGFAQRHHPCLLTVSLLGGGGFLHLQLDAEGIKMLEAAFEFGANASINLGIASGGVHIMAGIYFSMQTDAGKTKATLSGYLRMGGELSVLGLISLSLEFMLSFTLDTEGKASGRATLTVEVKVLFFSKSVEISVEKRFGGSGGDPTFAQLITSAGMWNDYAGAFA